jgi:ketosteroid isomerase-like protein
VASPVDVVRENSAAFSAMDVDRMLALYAEDAEVVDHRRVGFGTFRGHAELRPYYLGIFHSAAELREDLAVVAADGDVVVCHCELWGRLAHGPPNVTAAATYGLIATVRGGAIARLDIHEDGDDALTHSGLSRP